MGLDLGGLGLGDLLGGGGQSSGGGGSGFLSPSGKGSSAAYATVGNDVISHGATPANMTILIAIGALAAVIALFALMKR